MPTIPEWYRSFHLDISLCLTHCFFTKQLPRFDGTSPRKYLQRTQQPPAASHSRHGTPRETRDAYADEILTSSVERVPTAPGVPHTEYHRTVDPSQRQMDRGEYTPPPSPPGMGTEPQPIVLFGPGRLPSGSHPSTLDDFEMQSLSIQGYTEGPHQNDYYLFPSYLTMERESSDGGHHPPGSSNMANASRQRKSPHSTRSSEYSTYRF